MVCGRAETSHSPHQAFGDRSVEENTVLAGKTERLLVSHILCHSVWVTFHVNEASFSPKARFSGCFAPSSSFRATRKTLPWSFAPWVQLQPSHLFQAVALVPLASEAQLQLEALIRAKVTSADPSRTSTASSSICRARPRSFPAQIPPSLAALKGCVSSACSCNHQREF